MISAAVLAGGESTRMGRDKALIAHEGRTLVEHVVDRLRTVSDDVFIVTKRPRTLEHLAVPVIADRSDVHSPLAGIATAVRKARYDYVFVCACDMPFVSPDLVRFLADRAVGHTAVVPRRDGRAETTSAVWSINTADDIDAALAVGERAVYRVLDTLDVAWIDEPVWKAIDPTGESFVNINTPEDLARL